MISPDLIGFGQIRRFVLFDFKNKTHEEYAIAFSLDETIEKIAIADPGKRRFIFEIKGYNRHSQDAYDFSKKLQLIDLSERGVNVIKKLPKGAGQRGPQHMARSSCGILTKKLCRSMT